MFAPTLGTDVSSLPPKGALPAALMYALTFV